jgi:hypothetical protein
VVDNLKNEYRMYNQLNILKNNLIDVYTDEDYVKPLKQFFKRRSGR